MTLCACGCGGEVKINKQTKVPNKYINGHTQKGKSSTPLYNGPMPLCACGCGMETTINQNTHLPNKYILGHAVRCQSEEQKQKHREFMTGKTFGHHTEEQNQNQSERMLGKNVGKTPSKETRQKIGKGNTGKKRSEESKQKNREAHIGIKKGPPTLETRIKSSATQQGIAYDEWESFTEEQPYCPAFNEACRESNREKYGRRCFICDLPQSQNITSTGKFQKLSVHHVDMDKSQGCDGKRWKLVPTCMWHHKHDDEMMYRIIYLLENNTYT